MAADLRVLSRLAEGDDKFASSFIMQERNWNHIASTPYNLLKTDRFSIPGAGIWSMHRGDQPVGLSGVYPLNKRIAVIGARTWIVPAHRTQSLMGDLVFPIQEEFCRDHGYQFMIMTFATNNLWLPRMIMRAASGKALQLGRNNANFYSGWNEFEKLHMIQYTEQKVLWKSLNGSILNETELNTR